MTRYERIVHGVDIAPLFPGPSADPPSSVERIRTAALQRFATDGIAATSFRAIAESAGVSIGLVQHHFGTKAALVAAVDEYVLHVIVGAIAASPLPSPPADSLAELGHRITSIMSDHPDVVDYVGRAFVERGQIANTIFDGLMAISTAQWGQFAEHGMLQDGVDRTWAPIHPLVLVLGTVILRAQIERHLTEPLSAPAQLRRWDDSATHLIRRGLFER